MSNEAEIADLQARLDKLCRAAEMAAWEASLLRIYDRQFGGAAAGGCDPLRPSATGE